MDPHPYSLLTPDAVLDAVESAGFACDGRLLALNSYENRVYQVGVEEGAPLVAKFYRPGRWSNEEILEEHAFTIELAEREIPVVAPLADEKGNTLHQSGGFRFALYPKRPGRVPELSDPDTLEWMGRFIARIHAVGGTKPFLRRPSIDIESFGFEPGRYLLEGGFIPADLEVAYSTLLEQLLAGIEACFGRAGKYREIRLHGDCHPGNVLWTEEGPHFVDFDDCRSGPAIQDLWMLLSGDRAEMTLQFSYVLEGYRDFCDFDPSELHLLEALRTLRMIHYSAWLARRWEDPAFLSAFPWFNTQKYWQDQILALREQAALLLEPPLATF
ncbi:MAG: serine/threonine protein kinase [Burkholderiales bacterium]|nr:serine/threonine protein kinase [Burkholderiales bacterium]